MTGAVIITVLLLLSFFGWQYVFSIYEVKVAVVPEKVSVGDRVSVRLSPLNSFGKKAPFRKVQEEVKIVKGAENIEVLPETTSEDFSFRAVLPGEVELHVASEVSLETNLVKINISDRK